MSGRKPSGFSNTLAQLVVEHPWRALLVPLLIVLFAVPGLRGLAPDSTYRAYFHEDDPLRLQVESLERRFANDDSVVLMVHNPDGVFNPRTAKLLVDLTEEMWRVPDVVRVESLSNYRWVEAVGDDIAVDPLIADDGPFTEEFLGPRGEAALQHEIVPEYLLSTDAKTALVIGFVRPGDELSSPAPGPVIEAVREMIDRHRDPDHIFHITGRVAVEHALMESAQRDMQAFVPVLLFIMALILIAVFRRIKAAAVPLVLVILAVVSALGIAGWLGVRISNITALLPQFMIGIGIATSVHILNAYFAARRNNYSKPVAVQHALAINAVPTVLTAVTTAVGFFSFMTSNIIAIGELGLVVGLGTIATWFLIYFFLGPLLVLLPERSKKYQGGKAPLDTLSIGPRLHAYVGFLSSQKKLIAAGFVGLIVLALTVAMNNQVNANPFRYFAEGHWVRDSNNFAEEHVNGAQGMEVVINTGVPGGALEPEFLRQVEAYQSWIDTQDGVVKTISIVDILKQTNRSLHGDEQSFYRLADDREALSQLLFLYTLNLPQGLDVSDRITAEEDAVRISVKWTLYDSALATRSAQQILEYGEGMGLNVETTGKMLLFQKLNGYVVNSFFTSIGLATLLISLLMILALRSVRLGLISLIPNIVPLVIGAAALVVVGKSFDIGTVVVMTVCLSIAVDDTIHFISAFRRGIVDGLAAEEAVKRAVKEVGPAIAVTTLVLVCAFGVFTFADFVPNQTFGFLAIVVLTVALLVDLTLLPVLLLLLYGTHPARAVSQATVREPVAAEVR
ncbi:RND family transporter [Alkalilimnicola ehrlichii]|uniref:efflux RND transporter permease subunit n=1 Tax=Alkalilimnicola ehrlichii TaxID=351052 RepID=UPI0011C081AD|nr:MMPL family transporter [Alkalilimnicola ehrlichii]